MVDKAILHPAEAQVREAFAARLDEDANADGLEPGVAQAIRDRARAIRDAMPILDFKRTMRVYHDSLDDGPSSGLDATDYRAGVREAQERLRAANPYSPDFERAVDAALTRGIAFDDVDLYEVTGIPAPAEKATVKPPTIEQRVAKAVAKATAPLDVEIRSLARELADFQAWRSR
jgi:hypothetical protein